MMFQGKALRRIALGAALALGGLAGGRARAAESDAALRAHLSDDVRLPPGFHISLLARVPAARSLAVDAAAGIVFVGTTGDAVWAVDLASGRARPVLTGLTAPNGVAFGHGRLYVATRRRVLSYDLGGDPARIGSPQVLFAGLPDKSWHGWRVLALGPQGRWLYVAVGSPCNVCQPQGLEGSILRLPVTGGTPVVFAHGIRNSVGLDFLPGTSTLCFTDNGADHLGDDLPPDELNCAARPGLDFGFPYYGGGHTRTREFAGQTPPADAVFPVVDFHAHVAPLGLHFYRGAAWPQPFAGSAFVAQHGSWNRSVPIGYRVMQVPFTEGRPGPAAVFADGFRAHGRTWGRPVGIAQAPNGDLLVSDDFAGAIYRIHYERP